jgi:hypothetical protein
MASTFSNLGLELQTTGENANTWGDKTNVNLELIDERLSAFGTVTNTSSFSLAAPSNATKSVNNGAATLKFTGSASAEVVVTMPAKTLLYNVINTTGQNLKFKCSTETTTATIKNGQNGTIHSDGSANVFLISTVANDFDDDVSITTGDGALLTLQTSEATVVDGDVLGALQFKASGETGADALSLAASIIAEADDEFDADSAATDFVFKLGTTVADDNTAIERMRLTHEGDLNLFTDNRSIIFGHSDEVKLTHVPDTGLTLTHTATGDGKPVVLNLKSEEDEIIDGETIGKILFTAGDTDGGDGAITSASIEAEADATFSSTVNSTDLVFQLGSDGAVAEKMRLAHEGVLTVTGAITSGGIVSGTGFTAGSAVLTEAELETLDGITAGTASASKALVVDGSKNIVSIGTLSASEVTATSDERLKSDIKTIDNALDKVMKLRGVSFTKQAERGIGVIAQEVEKIIPEVVHDGDYKSVAYGNMVGVLIEAIKELKTEIDTHKQGCKCHGS